MFSSEDLRHDLGSIDAGLYDVGPDRRTGGNRDGRDGGLLAAGRHRRRRARSRACFLIGAAPGVTTRENFKEEARRRSEALVPHDGGEGDGAAARDRHRGRRQLHRVDDEIGHRRHLDGSRRQRAVVILVALEDDLPGIRAGLHRDTSPAASPRAPSRVPESLKSGAVEPSGGTSSGAVSGRSGCVASTVDTRENLTSEARRADRPDVLHRRLVTGKVCPGTTVAGGLPTCVTTRSGTGNTVIGAGEVKQLSSSLLSWSSFSPSAQAWRK